MFWNSPKRRKQDHEDQNGLQLSVGQRFDLSEVLFDVIAREAGGSPFNMFTLAAASADVSVSSATARRGNAVGAGTSAVGGQVAGLAGYYAGAAIGTAAGAFVGSLVLPGIGTRVGAFIGGKILGAGTGALIGDRAGRSITQHLFNTAIRARTRLRFGGDFHDSQPAYTMRQRAEQQLSGSLLNARRYLGKEAQLMHQ